MMRPDDASCVSAAGLSHPQKEIFEMILNDVQSCAIVKMNSVHLLSSNKEFWSWKDRRRGLAMAAQNA
jgi:hypothetical protein